MKKIGIFAGSFDPIHDGHIEVARRAHELLELESVIFLVEENPWGNKQPVEISHRRNMVELVVEKETNLSQFVSKNKQFTITKTLPELESGFPDRELYFILGADIFMNMNQDQWPDLGKLLQHYIVVFERNRISEKEIQDHAKRLGIVVAILPSAHPNHSSTDVRISENNKKHWVPEPVANYIKDSHLYKN